MNCSCHVGFEPTHTLLCSERAVSPFSSSESSSEIRAFGCYPCQARQTISRQILPDKTAAQELAARGRENEPRARGGAKFWLCYIQTRSSLRVARPKFGLAITGTNTSPSPLFILKRLLAFLWMDAQLHSFAGRLQLKGS